MPEKINPDSEKKQPAIHEPAKAEESRKGDEHGGPKGLEPTRYGDWERKGICVDF